MAIVQETTESRKRLAVVYSEDQRKSNRLSVFVFHLVPAALFIMYRKLNNLIALHPEGQMGSEKK